MPTYLVETYVPRSGADELPGVRLLTAFFLPEDETCFLLYDAASAEFLDEVGRRARAPWQRVQQAILPAPRAGGASHSEKNEEAR